MATYLELKTLFNDSDLNDRVQVACLIAAKVVKDEDDQTANHANRLKWSKAAFANPVTAATAMLKVLLADNNTLTIAQIQNATDGAIQSAVDAAIDVFADGA